MSTGNEFKPGDIIEMKSGSAKMVVFKVDERGYVECFRYSESHDQFKQESLHKHLLKHHAKT